MKKFNDTYVNGTVSDAKLAQTDVGSYQMGITFKVADAPEGFPHRIMAYLFFTEKALPITEKALQELGWDPSRNAWALDELIDSHGLVGREASLVCAEETYEGETRWKVKFINASGGGLKNVLDKQGTSAFIAQLRRTLGVAPPAQAARKKQQYDYVGDSASMGLEDEVPF